MSWALERPTGAYPTQVALALGALRPELTRSRLLRQACRRLSVEAARQARPERAPALTMRQLEPVRSTAAERRTAGPAALQVRRALTMTARRELRAPRSLAHPTRTVPARPKRAPQSAAARMPREAIPNLERRTAAVPAAWRAWVGPMTEREGSTMSPARRVLPARRTQAIPRPVQALREVGRLE
jgi:hypothetical protein